MQVSAAPRRAGARPGARRARGGAARATAARRPRGAGAGAGGREREGHALDERGAKQEGALGAYEEHIELERAAAAEWAEMDPAYALALRELCTRAARAMALDDAERVDEVIAEICVLGPQLAEAGMLEETRFVGCLMGLLQHTLLDEADKLSGALRQAFVRVQALVEDSWELEREGEVLEDSEERQLKQLAQAQLAQAQAADAGVSDGDGSAGRLSAVDAFKAARSA